MKQSSSLQAVQQKIFLFAIVLLTIIFIAFGALLLFTSLDDVPSLYYYLAGVILIFGGMLTIKPEPKANLVIPFITTLVGMYSLARGAGLIESPWLMRAAGLASWLAAGVIVYVGLSLQRQS